MINLEFGIEIINSYKSIHLGMLLLSLWITPHNHI